MKTKIIGTLNNSMKVYVDSNKPNDSIFVGYKSVEMDAAVYFAPYIPSGPDITPWEELLRTLHVNHAFDPSKKKTSQDHIMDAIAVMQERYPGDYVIEEQYDTATMKFAYVMVFKSLEDKAIFVLKHSGQ